MVTDILRLVFPLNGNNSRQLVEVRINPDYTIESMSGPESASSERLQSFSLKTVVYIQPTDPHYAGLKAEKITLKEFAQAFVRCQLTGEVLVNEG